MVGLNLLVTGKPGVGKTNPRWAHCQAVKLFAASRWLYDGRDEQPDRRETRNGLARIGFETHSIPQAQSH